MEGSTNGLFLVKDRVRLFLLLLAPPDYCIYVFIALVWRSAPIQTTLHKEKKAPRDFQTLNKSAVQIGLTTAQEHFQYRATHDVRKLDSRNQQNQNTSQKIRFPPTMVFGVPTK